jgi:hypothetical protein
LGICRRFTSLAAGADNEDFDTFMHRVWGHPGPWADRDQFGDLINRYEEAGYIYGLPTAFVLLGAAACGDASAMDLRIPSTPRSSQLPSGSRSRVNCCGNSAGTTSRGPASSTFVARAMAGRRRSCATARSACATAHSPRELLRSAGQRESAATLRWRDDRKQTAVILGERQVGPTVSAWPRGCDQFCAEVIDDAPGAARRSSSAESAHPNNAGPRPHK